MDSLRKGKLFIFLLLFFSGSVLVFSQNESDEKFPRGAQYFLGTGDELLIRVNIWGFVNKPGQYMVPSETDLISLIAYAGGPAHGAKLSSIKIVHSNSTSNEKQDIEKVNVDEYLKKGDDSLIPRLRPGDTIVISGSKWFHLNSFLEFTTKIAVLVQIFSWVTYYGDR
ncbi:hypothetical protein GF337_18595 [candidate division KSB1 bacterium]|nr:hypothetical protein [candidate division KSB1 bacterium]